MYLCIFILLYNKCLLTRSWSLILLLSVNLHPVDSFIQVMDIMQNPFVLKPHLHCPGVGPVASRQFAAGGPGQTGTNRDEVRVRSYFL